MQYLLPQITVVFNVYSGNYYRSMRYFLPFDSVATWW
jgi:predicted RNA-binding protein